jgi:hypothetical protein
MPVSLAALLGFSADKTYAPWPVWSGSTSETVRFEPVHKKEAHRRYRMAREFDRVTKKGNRCHGGALGRTALDVLEAFTFDFLNFASGRLDPSYEAIARRAGIGVSAVHTALKRLRDLGILQWKRRFTEDWSDGCYSREQETNAYSIRPCSEWRGFTPPREAPTPLPDAWGKAPCMPNIIDVVITARRTGGDPQEQIQGLQLAAAGPKDDTARLMAALASLGSRVVERGLK